MEVALNLQDSFGKFMFDKSIFKRSKKNSLKRKLKNISPEVAYFASVPFMQVFLREHILEKLKRDEENRVMGVSVDERFINEVQDAMHKDVIFHWGN